MTVGKLISTLQELDSNEEIYVVQKDKESGETSYHEVGDVEQWSQDEGFTHYIIHSGELVSG
jgi:hypothetical protein